MKNPVTCHQFNETIGQPQGEKKSHHREYERLASKLVLPSDSFYDLVSSSLLMLLSAAKFRPKDRAEFFSLTTTSPLSQPAIFTLK